MADLSTPRATPSRSRPTPRILRSTSAWLGGFLIAWFVACAVAAPWLAPHPPETLVGIPFEGPSAQHWLGTDSLGRDLLSRVIYGARLSLAAGAVSVSLAILVGACHWGPWRVTPEDGSIRC